jgi:hypothetical protein
MYGEVLARRLTAAVAPPDRYPVDAYAIQHPGVPGPQSSQSVLAHLVSLGLIFERGSTARAATQAMATLISANKGMFSWLEPPASVGSLTAADVVAADSDDELDQLVVEWARSAWDAWSPHHPTVREFYPAS